MKDEYDRWYMKTFRSTTEIDDAWIISDQNGCVVAILDTELQADVIMDFLTERKRLLTRMYRPNEQYPA